MQPWIKDAVTGPATGLIVAGSINAVSALFVVVSVAYQMASGQKDVIEGDEAYRMGYYVGRLTPIVASVLSIIVAPIVIYGGAQMLKLRSYALAKTAAVLTIIPCTSVCCLVGIPIGIWAVMALNKPEVKQAFDQPPPPAGHGWNP
jgi:hypothetical protein